MPTQSNDNPRRTPDFYLWLDFETPGSRYYDKPIEFAAVLTDNSPDYLIAWHTVGLIKPEYDSDKWIPIVRDMHAESGLITDINDPRTFKFPSCREADDWIWNNILVFLNSIDADNSKITLAGSGVSHFDSLLLKNHFPKVWSLLSGFDDSDFLKPTLDIGVIRRFLYGTSITLPTEFVPTDDLLKRYSNANSPHRALYDVILFIKQARWLRWKLEDIMSYSKDVQKPTPRRRSTDLISQEELNEERNISRSD